MSDNIFYIIFAAIIQGLTEFLPISSSGHLIILKEIFQININNLDFEILLHLGTVFSIIFYYRKDIIQLGHEFIKNKNQYFYFIIIGCLPIAFIGLLIKDIIYIYFNNILFLPYTFIVSSIFLFLTRYFNKSNNITFKIAFIVGLFQIFALFPGISRSGITIASLLILGVNQKDAIRFSFLMAIPLILGASLLEINFLTISYFSIIGTIISFLFGWVSIYITNILLINKKYWMFSIYCFIISILIFIWNFSL